MAVRTALANYLKAAIDDEWPAMARETESSATEHALEFAICRSDRPQSEPGRGARRT